MIRKREQRMVWVCGECLLYVAFEHFLYKRIAVSGV